MTQSHSGVQRRFDQGPAIPCLDRADVPEAKAELAHAIYERIVVAGRRIVSARLTPSAYEHGLALALPEKVVMARPPVLSDWD